MRTVEEIGADIDRGETFEGVQKYISELYRLAKYYETELFAIRIGNDPGDDRINTIYDTYPRKAAKPAAIRAIKSAIKKVGYANLLKHVQAYAAHHKQAGIDMQFTPMPATWFNQERWNDLPVESAKPTSPVPAWVSVDRLKQRILMSPAYPGGPNYVDHSTEETKAALKRDIAELKALRPGETLDQIMRSK